MTSINLAETGTELLLFIHASQKERAKRIEGRRWDPKRRCWVYPKTTIVYDALVAEFGEDLAPLTVSRPTPNAAELQRQTDPSANDGATARLLHKRESELDELRHALREEQREVERLREINSALQTRIMADSDGLQDLMDMMESMKVQQDAQQLDERLKDVAMETTGSDPGFARIVETLEVNDLLPIELAKRTHFQLLKLLEVDPDSREARDITFERAIGQAQREKGLDREARDLAHAIRRQGNIVRHETVHKKTYAGRAYFTLLAASLLWPHLPE